VNGASPAPPESPGTAYRRGDYATAVKLLKPQAAAGRVDAQIMLGQMYLRGEGVEADATQAIAWIRKAADAGSPLAAYDLGVFSSNGVGGPVDGQAAAIWFRKAAHQWYPDAAYNLSVLYHDGVGVERSDALALNWINAGLAFLPASAGPSLRARFKALRDKIEAGMAEREVSGAPRLVSPDGPLFPLTIHNKDAFLKKAVKEYPLGLRQLGRGGLVVALVLVHADGTVGDAIIETSSGYAQIDEVTRRLLKTAEAEPRRIDGEPTESWQILRWQWSATEVPWDSFGRANALPR
jgi:TonB family protein